MSLSGCVDSPATQDLDATPHTTAHVATIATRLAADDGTSNERSAAVIARQALPYTYFDEKLTDVWHAFRISFDANATSTDLELSGKLISLGRPMDPTNHSSPSFDRFWPGSINLVRYAGGHWSYLSGRLFLGGDWTCDEYTYDLRSPLVNMTGSEAGYDCRSDDAASKSGWTISYTYELGRLAVPEEHNEFYLVVQALGDSARPFWLNVTGSTDVSLGMNSGGYENLRQFSHMEFDGGTAGRATVNRPHDSQISASVAFGKDLVQNFTTENYTFLWAIDSLFFGTARHHYVDPFGHEVQGMNLLGTKTELGGNETLYGLAAFGGAGTWRYHQDELMCGPEPNTFCEGYLFYMDIPLPRP